MVKEAGCDAVKLEGGGPAPAQSRARAIIGAGIPGHGTRRADPAELDRARRLEGPGPHRRRRRRESPPRRLALQGSGCFAIVFEAIPSAVTKELMPHIEVPVIGIGAGPDTDGQVLVFHDLLGIRDGLGPRFVKRYANLQQEMNAGVGLRAKTCAQAAIPGPEHGYSIDAGELAELHDLLA